MGSLEDIQKRFTSCEPKTLYAEVDQFPTRAPLAAK
jgi:hypothetical protein